MHESPKVWTPRRWIYYTIILGSIVTFLCVVNEFFGGKLHGVIGSIIKNMYLFFMIPVTIFLSKTGFMSLSTSQICLRSSICYYLSFLIFFLPLLTTKPTLKLIFSVVSIIFILLYAVSSIRTLLEFGFI